METIRWATKNEVIGRLRMAGLSMKDFAIKEGFEPNTVRKVVSRYAGSNRRPRGTLAAKILKKLRSTIAG
jgi:lambda repressor-like predicted transcriptional regulator